MKNVVIKDSARNKGAKAYMEAVEEAKRVKASEHRTKSGINIRKLAKKIILF